MSDLLWIPIGIVAFAALIFLAACVGRFIAGPHAAQERREAQAQREAELDAAGKRAQDAVQRLGKEAEERSPRFRNWSPS